eukprot:CAMPEP_0170554992 /NCGR_PEP_ID=MMETSP0211-20121228/12871_1 /TAXON_ID=311385 /ORGANISM="Pseudokeronopsis sp., Strain OXSARD2" /LENGTH=52 /DNA_ID=CAMNT_0010864479 /DNA_START=434 /DNA_END=589 /DNA_ORIENTATION=-
MGFEADFQEVMCHQFLQGLELEKLIKKELTAPYQPSPNYCKNYDETFMAIDE